MTKVYKAIYDFFTPEIYNDLLFENLKKPQTIEDKLKILKTISFLFKEFNSIEDIKKGCHSQGSNIVSAYSCKQQNKVWKLLLKRCLKKPLKKQQNK